MLFMQKDAMHEERTEDGRSLNCAARLCGPRFYKRTAKPRKTLPKTAARPRPALGMKMEPAPPWSLEPPLLLSLSLEPVSEAPPKPVTGMVFEAEPSVPVAAAVEAMVVGREVLPRYGS